MLGGHSECGAWLVLAWWLQLRRPGDTTGDTLANRFCEQCNRVHWEPRVVVVDGKELCTHSGFWQRECEIRYALLLPDKARKPRITKRDYLNMVEEKRGTEARLQLRAEMIRRYKK